MLNDAYPGNYAPRIGQDIPHSLPSSEVICDRQLKVLVCLGQTRTHAQPFHGISAADNWDFLTNINETWRMFSFLFFN